MGVCRGAACFFLGSGLLLAGLVLTPTVVAAPSSVPQSVDASAGGTPGKLLRLQAGSFDPVAGAPPLPGALAAPAGPQNQDYYIVQFNGTVLPEWRAAVEAVGGVLYGYVPDHAYLVKLSKADVHRVRRLPEVRWVGLYEPGYRVSPGLFGWLTSGEEVEVLVAAFEPDAVTTADTIIRSQGGRVHDRSMGTRPVLRARVAGRALPQIARVKGIAWVEEYVPPELLNDVAGGIMHADDVWLSPALAGAGQIVAIADTGLDVGVNDPAVIHPDLLDSDGDETRIVGTEALGRPPLWDDPHGHGTHVAGSVLGNGHQSLDTSPAVYRGAAPEASLYFQSVLDYSGGLGGLPSDLGTLFGSAYDAGARIHTNSWGSVGNEAIDLRGTYTTSSWQIDDYAWSHRDLAILFAAGNAGVDTSPADGVVDLDSLTTQATAKNCITIGASENYRADQVWTWSQVWPLFFPNTPIADDRMADNAAGIAAFSGRGPTDDGRIKPDLVAPGTWVISTRTGADSYNIGFESGELSAWQNVVPGPGWQVSDVGAGAHSGRYVLSNGTPAVSYAPNLTTRIYSPFLDFSRYGDSESAELSVWMKYNLRGSDYILVYICGWDTGGLFNYTTKRYDGSTGGEWVSETFRVYRNQLGWPQSVYAVLELNTAAGPVPPGYYCLWDDFTWAANSTLWGVVDDDYVQSGGTSMATPLTAGGVALVRQHYTDDLGITPSSALLKATLIATADDLTPGQYPGYQEVSERPDRSQGWGRVNLRDAIAPVPPAQVLYWDRSTGLGQGASDSVEVGVTDASVPLRVALVWTDPPTATPAVVPQLVNDLDLVVTDPSSGTHLAMGGVGDHLNNVENVDLASPELGVHTVTVIGHDVNGPDQPYALVIYGAATAACGDTEPPSAPTLQLAYPLSATRINLDWTDSTDNVGVDHYEVYRDDAVTAIRPSSSYQDSSLCPVTTYTYHVVAVDACGNRSEPSNERAVTTYALAAPYNIVATPLGSWGMSVGWTKGHPLDEVSGYEVSRDGGAGQSVELPPFFEQGLTAETTYTYRVRAFGVCGHEEHASGWSDPPGSGETGRLAAPEGLAAELADGWGVNLTWVPGDALDQIEGYYVYRTDKLPNPMGQTSGLSYRDSTAPAETSCSYYVVVYDAAGHTSPPSDTVSAPTTPPLPAPVGLTYAYKTSPQVQVDLTWYDAEPLAPKAGFRIYREGEPRAERDYPLWSDSRFSGLQTNRQYEYRVSCYDAAGHESALSDPVLVRTETPSGDTVGVYTSGNGLFYLRHFSSTGYADVSFRYGPAPSTWLPIAGDWDGNGTDTIGLYNP
ncbi:MAG: S8 family serine peptidase, partial [Armatimonadota bacterium]